MLTFQMTPAFMCSVLWSKNYTVGGTDYGIRIPPNCNQSPRILDPASPFNNVYNSGVPVPDSSSVDTGWAEIAQNIATLDLSKPGGTKT